MTDDRLTGPSAELAAERSLAKTEWDGVCPDAEVHLAGGTLVEGQTGGPKHNGRIDACTRAPIRNPVCTCDIDDVAGRIASHLNQPSPSNV